MSWEVKRKSGEEHKFATAGAIKKISRKAKVGMEGGCHEIQKDIWEGKGEHEQIKKCNRPEGRSKRKMKFRQASNRTNQK